MMILSGKTIAPLLEEELKERVKKTPLSFYLFSNQDDFPSQAYLRGIKKTLSKFEIPFEEDFLDSSKSEEENLSLFKEHSQEKMVLLARPLHVPYEEKLIKMISPDFDPDMFSDRNRGRLFSGDMNYLPATASAVREIVAYYHLETEGKRACILGRSNEVGYPCFAYFNKKNATASLIHSRTPEEVKADLFSKADILVLATGKSGLVKREWLKKDCVILDCGFSPNGGDLGFVPEDEEVKAYTPVPGGVGALTKLCLVKNALFLAENK